jgi:hypothetical protein
LVKNQAISEVGGILPAGKTNVKQKAYLWNDKKVTHDGYRKKSPARCSDVRERKTESHRRPARFPIMSGDGFVCAAGDILG